MVTFGFYDSLAGDRKYNALQLSSIFDGIIADGVFATIGEGLVVVENTGVPPGMFVIVKSGRAWFNRTWTLNDSWLYIAVPSSEIALNRIDSVVVEVNSDLATRANSIKVIPGTPATTPVPPTLANTATLHQYALANIYVGLGVTSIYNANLTNLIGTVQTPFVTGAIVTVSAADLLGKFESQFDAWMLNLQDQLDDNQAGNLQVQIDALVAHDSSGWTPAPGPWSVWDLTNGGRISVPAGALSLYEKGYGIRYKQGGAYKYAYIWEVDTDTLLRITGGTDHVLVSGAITDIWYARLPDNAFGFPSTFTYNANRSGFTTVGTDGGEFRLAGGLLTVNLNISGTSNANTFGASMPISVQGLTWMQYFVCKVIDNGVAATGIARVSTSAITFFKDWTESANWAASGAKGAQVTITGHI